MAHSLGELVRAGTFSARKHHRRLEAEEDLPWVGFAELQRRYRAARDEQERRSVAREFERLVRLAHEQAEREKIQPPPYAGAPFTEEHFRAWAADLELDNGEPWKVEDYFADFAGDVFSGYKIAWLLVPEGNAKTTGLAGLALYHCEFTDHGFVPWAASARDQAEIGYRQAEGFVLRSPRLRALFQCQEGYRRIKCAATGSRIQIFAAGSEHADGVIPTLPIIDELHRHKNLALYRTWVGKLAKRGGQLAVISTAGEPGSEFEIAKEKIREGATQVAVAGAFGRYATDRLVMHEYAVRDETRIRDLEAVKEANPFSKITADSLREKLDDPTMTDAHWRRFTCNLATVSDGVDLYLEDWDAWAVDEFEIPEGTTVCLGADGSRTWDTTVVAWASGDDDGNFSVDARIFSVRPEVGHHVLHRGGRIDFDDIEGFVLDRFTEFRVKEAAYDPRYLERSMEVVGARLNSSYVFPVEPQSKAMRDALQALFNLGAEGKLRHSGDPEIRAHVANTGVERGLGSEIKRVRKIDSRLPIDAVPAMALAVWRAAHVARPSVYRERGVLAV